MPDISVALALLKKPIEAALASIATKTKESFAKLYASQNIKTIYQQLNATQKVKTIWNVDRAITLNSFYFPAKIKSSFGSQQIASLDDLPSNAVVLQGTVGQGKSILLRYLLGKEIRSGKRIPLFIELRRIPKQDLASYLRTVFNDLVGYGGSADLFGHFASEGLVSVLLDGFDEVDPERVAEVATSIEALAFAHPTARIIVTSRPNSGVETLPLFDVIQIAPLKPADLPDFFNKILGKDKALSFRLSESLKNSGSVAELASTPLLATLLTIVYRAHQRIPVDFSEFYDELFQILLVRHDRSKAGAYDRKRKTKLSDREIEQAFEGFSYKTKSDGKSSLDKVRAVELAKSSLSSLALAASAESFLDDIIKVTCLLQQDGGRIDFLHQSVQEFFAARYVQSRPEEIAQRFYSLVLTEKKWSSWDQVLRFLGQLDKYRASKYFYIPALSETLRYLESYDEVATPSRLLELVGESVGVRQAISADKSKPSYMIQYVAPASVFRVDALYRCMFGSLFGTAVPWRNRFDKTSNGQLFSYAAIASHANATKQLEKALADTVQEIRTEFQFHLERVDSYNASSAFMDL